MLTIEIEDTLESQIDVHILARAARVTLEGQSETPVDTSLSVVITSDKKISELNTKYRGVNAPTDVLSFTADHTDPDTQSHYIGDVLISLPRAQAQASQSGHSLETELQLLVVHGILHLLGYDHAESDEKQQMWAVQAEILNRLGISEAILKG